MDSRATFKIEYRDPTAAPPKVHVQDPCFLGLPELLTGAHVVTCLNEQGDCAVVP